jgi:hypothetical protein
MSFERPGEYFSAFKDPWYAAKDEHRLIDILIITIGAVIAYVRNWDDTALKAITSSTGCDPSRPWPTKVASKGWWNRLYCSGSGYQHHADPKLQDRHA